MIRSLIATSAAMLFMGGTAIPGWSNNSARDAGCLVSTLLGAEEPCDITGPIPPPMLPAVTEPIMLSPRLQRIYSLFRAADTLPAAIVAPPRPVPVTGVQPRPLPDNLRWVSHAVAAGDTPLPDSAPPTTRSPYALPGVPGPVAPPRATSSADETLPAPTPVRTAPAEAAPCRVVSDAVFALPAILRTRGMVNVDLDGMVWLSPSRHTPTGISATGPAGTPFTQGAGDSLGDEHLSRHALAGAQVALGYWWTEDNPWVPGGKLATGGVETRFMSVAQRSVGFVDDQSSTLTRPFFDLATGLASGVVVATPGLATGSLFGTASESWWGLEANVWQTLHRDWPGTTFSVEGMLGLRYLDLSDGITLGQASSFVANPVNFPAFAALAGNRIADQESFTSQNRFIGGQAGVRGNLLFDTFIVTGQLQLGVGDTNEQINIQGSQLRTLANGQTIVSQGAVLALPGNIGRYTENKLAVVPEMGLKFTVPINGHVSLSLGFTTLYWSRIARPADQVEMSINSSQIPSFPGATPGAGGVTHSGIPFNQSDMWLMGASFSVQVKW
jgi:Putative beta barrel porin-7 (BBP7)